MFPVVILHRKYFTHIVDQFVTAFLSRINYYNLDFTRITWYFFNLFIEKISVHRITFIEGSRLSRNWINLYFLFDKYKSMYRSTDSRALTIDCLMLFVPFENISLILRVIISDEGLTKLSPKSITILYSFGTHSSMLWN